MEDNIKDLQLEVSELKESLKMSVELNEKLAGEVDELRDEIISMKSQDTLETDIRGYRIIK